MSPETTIEEYRYRLQIAGETVALFKLRVLATPLMWIVLRNHAYKGMEISLYDLQTDQVIARRPAEK